MSRKPIVDVGDIVNGRKAIERLPKKTPNANANAARYLVECVECGKRSEVYGPTMKRAGCRHCAAKAKGLKLRKPKPLRTDEDRAAWAKKCREYRKTEKGKRSMKAMNLKKFGLTFEEFQTMVEDQSGACAICGKTPDQLCVDHCHETGKVRGLLCHGCNRGIGLLKDDPNTLRKAAAYVERCDLLT